MRLAVNRLDAMRDAALAALVVKTFAGKNVSLAHMKRFLSNPMNYLLAAHAEDNLAGFLLAYALERVKEDSHKMFIYEIEVAEKYRRKGVGKALISRARDIARQENMLSAFVFTNHSNKGAVEFYKSTGASIENGDDLLFVYKD